MKSLDPFDEPDNLDLDEKCGDANWVEIGFFTIITFIDRNFTDLFKVDSTPKLSDSYKLFAYDATFKGFWDINCLESNGSI